MPIAEDLLRIKRAIEQAQTEKARIEGQITQLEKHRADEFNCHTDEEAATYMAELQTSISELTQEIEDGVSTIKQELGW